MKKDKTIVCLCICLFSLVAFAQAEEKGNPTIVNADKLEYSQDKTTITAQGNVEIIKDESVLTCDRAVVNTATNDAHAEGKVKLVQKKGILTASSFDYNLKTKTGIGYDAKIIYPPYFGRGAIVKKVSEDEIDIKNGYITTCDKEHPHYRIQTRLAEFFPQDKVTTRGMTFRVGDTPILFMPKYTQNLKDDRMHVQVTPGKSKDWGLFLLTAWRYDLLANSGGRVHLDYREKRDFAWGIDNYYDTKVVGKGYFTNYYMRERRLGRKHVYMYPRIMTPEKSTKEYERYRIQWRHKWEVDKNTYWLAEYHKLRDPNFIKDYFFREYEKNSQLATYILFNHILPDSSAFNLLIQKRANRIFTETEKLPEITWDKPATELFNFSRKANNEKTADGNEKSSQDTGAPAVLYFSNSSSFLNLNNKTAAPSEEDSSNTKFDNYTKLSLPFKLAFLDINPYAGTRETYYRRFVDKQEGIFREVWDSGVNLTTRFYRTFDLKAEPFGMQFNQLRHIISPSVNYAYTHPPTVASSKLIDLGGISESNQLGLSLENKLQTKRKNKTVDFLRFIANTDYLFNIEGRRHSWVDTVSFDLEMQLSDWLRFESDATLNRRLRRYTLANFDLTASGDKVSWGGGYRYERKSSSQMTGEILFNLLKGWSFKIYERFQFKGNSLVKEQTYAITKELHCWILDINYNVLRERGETIWFALRLKAFPELSIDYSQNYHEPKPHSQGYLGGKASD